MRFQLRRALPFHSLRHLRTDMTLNRRDFLNHAAACALLANVTNANARARQTTGSNTRAAAELDERTIADLQTAMASGGLTARRITEIYLARIAEVDRGAGNLNSVIEVNPDALTIADQLDRERQSNRVRGALHGIPVLLKDNLDTADSMMTTAGSLALEGSRPVQDSTVAAKLRLAGCVILGKTNLSEWANFRSTRSSSGWSGRGGQTRNPYALDRNPCGSSSGSGASVSANLCVVAVGTETDGSIVCPSSANGIVGIKPTVGLVSRAGIIPISRSQDTAGPMARTVRDAAILLNAMVGSDPRDRSTLLHTRSRAGVDYTRLLDPAGLRKLRIGVARNFFGFDPQVDKLMEEALTAMRDAGAEVIDATNITTTSKLGEPEFEVLLYEFKAGLNEYLASLPASSASSSVARVRTLADIIRFNDENREREMPYFGQEIFLRAEAKGALSDPAYRTARAQCRRLSRTLGIDATMNKHRLDCIVAPTGSPAWTTDLVNGDHFTGGSSSPAAIAGYPNVSVPAGFAFGLPVGISFFGRAYSEPVLLRAAYAFEQTTRHRRAPQLNARLNLAA